MLPDTLVCGVCLPNLVCAECGELFNVNSSRRDDCHTIIDQDLEPGESGRAEPITYTG